MPVSPADVNLLSLLSFKVASCPLYCLSPLNSWTKIVNQFSYSKFRKYGKNKTSIYGRGEV